MKNPYTKKQRKPFLIDPKKPLDEVLDDMSETAFQGRSLGEVFKVWQDMLKDPNVTIFLGYSGSLSTAGMWKIIYWFIENRFIDVLVSTGANISEDIFEAMGFKYWLGTWRVDDADLLKHKLDRFYDHYAGEYDYRDLESLLGNFMATLGSSKIHSSRSFLYELGLYLAKKDIHSLATIAAKKKVPIFSPALIDSGYGMGANIAKKMGKPVIIDQAKDMYEMAEIGRKRTLDEKGKTAVIYIGGGVPKDMTQLVTISLCLMSGGEDVYPHHYSIQITTDSPQWGGLSGCTIGEEAISWGKEAPEGENATVYCDATIALPLLATALSKRIKARKNPPDLSWLFKNEKDFKK